MTFASNVFKIFETAQSQIMRMEAIQQVVLPGLPGPEPGAGVPRAIQGAEIVVRCGKCGHELKVHAAFQKGVPVPSGSIRFPADNQVKCPSCGTEHNLSEARRQLEGQSRRPIVSEGETNAGI